MKTQMTGQYGKVRENWVCSKCIRNISGYNKRQKRRWSKREGLPLMCSCSLMAEPAHACQVVSRLADVRVQREKVSEAFCTELDKQSSINIVMLIICPIQLFFHQGSHGALCIIYRVTYFGKDAHLHCTSVSSPVRWEW